LRAQRASLKSRIRPRASLIPAQGNALGKSNGFSWKANGLSHSMNVTCGINQRSRGTLVARGGGPMNRARWRWSYDSSRTCSWGVSPGWYELTPLASPGAFNGRCPNSSRQAKAHYRHGLALRGRTGIAAAPKKKIRPQRLPRQWRDIRPPSLESLRVLRKRSVVTPKTGVKSTDS